jgi:hypothetical protein
VALTPTLNEPLPLNVQDAIPDQRKTHALDVDTVRLRGEFQIANARKRSEKQAGEITIVTSGNVEIRVVVPPGMMSDIVKPLWESEVEVIGTRKGKRIHLIQIKAATD